MFLVSEVWAVTKSTTRNMKATAVLRASSKHGITSNIAHIIVFGNVLADIGRGGGVAKSTALRNIEVINENRFGEECASKSNTNRHLGNRTGTL